MKSKKITSMLLAAILLLGTSITASATEGVLEPHSITINGVTTVDKSIEKPNSVKNAQPEKSITITEPQSVADNGWEYDGIIPNTITSVKTTFNNYSKLFYNHSVTIPVGCNYTFEWFQRVQDTNYTTKSIDGGVRLQGGYKFLAEIEGHVSTSYTTSKTVAIERGIKSTVGVLAAGSYNMNWYMKTQKYDLNSNWRYYTTNSYGDVTYSIGNRRIATVEEATQYLHLDVKKL